MAFNLRFLCFLSVILFIGSTNSLSKRYWTNSNETIVINRFVANQKFYTIQMDRTTFSVDEPVWLEQFVIPKVFTYELIKQAPVSHVSVMVKIFETPKDVGFLQGRELIFMQRTEINRMHETKVIMPSGIRLKPEFVYEIRLEIPKNMIFIYNEELGTGKYLIDRPLAKPITINFNRHSLAQNLPNNLELKLSHGMLKRIQFKYSQF